MKVAYLNADRLDGIDSSQFQRRVANTRGAGTAVVAVAVAANGTGTCGDNTTGLQNRVTGTCSGTNAVQSVAANGSVTCSTGPVWAVANVGVTGTSGPPAPSFATVSSDLNNVDGVAVTTYDPENTTTPPPTDKPLHPVVVC